MKKIFICLVVFIFLLTAISCAAPRNYEEDVFFSDKLLEQHCLSGLPVPDVRNSRLSGGELYLNISSDEYFSYVRDTVAYLKSRDDIFYLSFVYHTALIAEIVPYDVCAPIDDGYSYHEDHHTFVFSMNDKLDNSGSIERVIIDPLRITIERCQSEKKLPRTDFSYNTVIKLSSDTVKRAQFSQCEVEHTYGDGVPYVIPGGNRAVLVSHCIHCGYESMSDFISDSKFYDINVVSGIHLIKSPTVSVAHASCISGLKVEYVLRAVTDCELVMRVNGERIYPHSSDDSGVYFGFIMPCADVTVQIEAVDYEAPDVLYLFNMEPWISELNADSVSQIKLSNEIAGVAPGMLNEHFYTNDPEAIQRIVAKLRSLIIEPVPREEAQVSGGSTRIISLRLLDGREYVVSAYSGVYNYGDLYFKLTEPLPSLNDNEINLATFSFVTYPFSEIYKFYSDGELIGEYSDIGEYEFQKYEGEVSGQTSDYLECTFGTIDIYDERIFSLWQGGSVVGYYKLTADKTFAELLSEK